MKLLAFDTSSSACSVAMQHGDDIQSLHTIAPMQHARLILTMIKELLGSTHLTLDKLDGIAYGSGPGSFTGLRIASSVAQGLGLATKLPLIPISSLATIAQTAYLENQWLKLLVALDARMEKIYWAQYEVTHHGKVELTGKEMLCAPNEITIYDHSTDWYGIGDGWEKYPEIMKNKLQFEPQVINFNQLPNAKAMLDLAKLSLEKGNFVDASHAFPTYLR